MQRGMVFVGFWCLLAGGVSGATFDVSTLAAFQSGLDIAATNGAADTIRLGAGVYAPTSTLRYVSAENWPLNIEGAGSGVTVLDGSHLVQLLSVETTASNGHVSVVGVGFRWGRAAGNGGALVIQTEAANIDVADCLVEQSAAVGGESIGGGAALTSQSGTMTVSDCEFWDNLSAGNVGGLFIGTYAGFADVARCLFVSNRVENIGANEAFGDGGGLMFYSDGPAHGSIHNSLFRGNSASGGSNPDGGGLMTYQTGASSVLELRDNVFTNNVAGLGGGGCILRVNVSCDMEVSGNVFTHNRTLIGSGAGLQAYINAGSLIYSNNQHRANQSAEDGGGSWIDLLAGDAVVQANTYAANAAANNGGGLSFTTDSATGSIAGDLFFDNVATNVGGGLNLAAGTGMLYAHNNTLYNNNAGGEGGCIYVYLDQTNATCQLYNNILWQWGTPPFGYSYGSGGGSLSLTYSAIQNAVAEPWVGVGCTTNDPHFRNADGDNFRLGWTGYPAEDGTKSSCIDSGNPVSPLDPDGTRADMGAFAFPQGVAVRGTPHWWLEEQGLTSGGGTFDEAEVTDTDGDQSLAWEEYVAATDPNNRKESFCITSYTVGLASELSFMGYTTCVYTLQGRTDLTTGAWSNVPGAIQQDGSGGESTLSDTNEPARGPFYRLWVARASAVE